MKMPMSWLANGSLPALMALVFSAASPADDQARAKTTPPTTEEIIVTSQFLEQRSQDTSRAITAMPAQSFEARNQTRILDLDAFVGASENAANIGLATAVVGRPRGWSLSIMRRF